MKVDLSNEVERWAAGWSHLMNRAEERPLPGRRPPAYDSEYQRTPEFIGSYIAAGIPVLPLVEESWATRAVQAAGIALVYLPERRAIVGWEVRTGVWAVLACQSF